MHTPYTVYTPYLAGTYLGSSQKLRRGENTASPPETGKRNAGYLARRGTV